MRPSAMEAEEDSKMRRRWNPSDSASCSRTPKVSTKGRFTKRTRPSWTIRMMSGECSTSVLYWASDSSRARVRSVTCCSRVAFRRSSCS
jgi:hypothetical protein